MGQTWLNHNGSCRNGHNSDCYVTCYKGIVMFVDRIWPVDVTSPKIGI